MATITTIASIRMAATTATADGPNWRFMLVVGVNRTMAARYRVAAEASAIVAKVAVVGIGVVTNIAVVRAFIEAGTVGREELVTVVGKGLNYWGSIGFIGPLVEFILVVVDKLIAFFKSI